MTTTIHIAVLWCEEHKKGRWGVAVKNALKGSRVASGTSPDSTQSMTAALLAACVNGIKTVRRAWVYEKEVTLVLGDDAAFRLAAGLKIRNRKDESQDFWSEQLKASAQQLGFTLSCEKSVTGDQNWLLAKRVAKRVKSCHECPPALTANGELKKTARGKTNIRRLLGELNNTRGKAYEDLVLDSIGRLNLDWIISARLATRAEDRNQIDIVCESTYGPLFLQVKSSRSGAERFREEYPHRTTIECVVATPVTDILDRRVHAALCNLRGRTRRQA